MQHPLSGYGLHFFLKEFELRKLTGKYLVEFQHKPKVYTNGYRSPYEKYERRFPVGIAAMLNDLTQAEKMEFRPMVKDIGFPRPRPDDPRARKPKVDEADYAEKLKAHNAFLKEREVYQEIQYVRDDFSLLTSVVAEAYGPNFFSYITRNSSDFEMRKKCRIIPTSRQYVAGAVQCLVHPRNVPFSPQKVKARISKAPLLAKRNLT